MNVAKEIRGTGRTVRKAGPGRLRRIGFGVSPTLALLTALAVIGASGVGAQETACADCHDVDVEAVTASVHGFLGCGECHQGTGEVPHAGNPASVRCADCHDDVVATYNSSIHGQVRSEGGEEAPDCTSCHGTIHTLRPGSDPESPVNHSRLHVTCGQCHSNPEVVKKYGMTFVQPIQAYEASVHARAVEADADSHAATCNDCHSSHGIQPAADPRSTVYHQRVPETCGRCHQEIALAYEASVHGIASARGARESPVCTDCHGEHRILSPSEAGSPVYASNVPKMTCGRCHGDIRLNEKYGLPGDKVPAYQDSYHGLAIRSGIKTVAHCGSCHGIHDILPSSDPRSHVSQANLATTCGQCHPGIEKQATIGAVHSLGGMNEPPLVGWVRTAYIWIIFGTIGFMLLHNGLDLLRKMRQPPLPPQGQVVDLEQRMSVGFRLAHAMMAISFIVLVYTGFALKFPESWWAAPLLAWESSMDLRGGLHRAAGLVMIASLLVHAAHLMASRRARACIAEMRPRLHDVIELKERFRWYLGLRPAPPPAPRLGYPEKMEYLALIWGSLLMAATGCLLWFEEWTLSWLPVWASDLATVVHLYEAILASLAILVWHFYFVIFDPVVYPLDRAFLTGRSPAGRIMERQAEAVDHDQAAGQPAETAPTAARSGRGR